MNSENIDQNRNNELVDVQISGQNSDEWQRVGTKVVALIENISDKIIEASGVTKDSESTTVADITSIATEWAKAKTEKPSLENDVLKANIMKALAEARKIDNESAKIATDNKNSEVLGMIEAMERLVDLQLKMQKTGITLNIDNGVDQLEDSEPDRLPNNAINSDN